ncbi:hypothetical protein BDV27DRAFT_139802 [Aspergillus caelatus]|uniref:Uncharacterized protein n=1 Tax=Aspergillus caelatus TaxID=61420 RepID=A0A5N6ZI73_9EURO|nr:uncharacterized protein BDV27DRAFT_139802 [Aspergillus caelatus]KAE8357195.1 hypothetical protein BDV27DRAFT_139802 [Aspergillus caelatus]
MVYTGTVDIEILGTDEILCMMEIWVSWFHRCMAGRRLGCGLPGGVFVGGMGLWGVFTEVWVGMVV